MAIIYSYPVNTNILATDIILGSSTVIVNGKRKNQTKSFEVADLATFINAGNTLDSVLTNGNTSLLDAKIGELYLYDNPNGGYAKISIQDDVFLISRAGSGTKIFEVDDGETLTLDNGVGQANILNNLTTTRNYTLPNASGTFALTSNLSAYVPYTGATGPVNLGPYNLTVNSISVGRGGGGLGSNTVLGNSALSANVTGTQITAIGNLALDNNTANNNTAVGFKAMQTNTTGNTNTSVGSESLQTNLSGNENSAFGYRALYTATSAVKNNAFGRLALGNILTGNQNIGIGNNAGLLTATANQNTAGGFSIYIGNDTKPSLDSNQNEIVIGYNANGVGSNSVVLGNTNILTTRLRGAVQGGSFVKDSGTAIQYLMADGSISTNGTLFSAVSTIYQATAGTLQNISSAIPSNIFASGNLLKLNAAITTTAASVAIVTIEFYINSAATTVGATLIGRYNGPIGNQYIPVDRFFWVSGTTIYGRDFTASASTSTSNSTFAINSVAIPATQFYIIAQVTTTSTDRAAISSFHVEKS